MISLSSYRLHFQQTTPSKAANQSNWTTTRPSLHQANFKCLLKLIIKLRLKCNNNNNLSSNIDTSRLLQVLLLSLYRATSHLPTSLKTASEAFSYPQGSCSTTNTERNSTIQALLCIAEPFLCRHLEAVLEGCKAPLPRAPLRIFPYNPQLCLHHITLKEPSIFLMLLPVDSSPLSSHQE